jgi:hypothetical protein
MKLNHKFKSKHLFENFSAEIEFRRIDPCLSELAMMTSSSVSEVPMQSNWKPERLPARHRLAFDSWRPASRTS